MENEKQLIGYARVSRKEQDLALQIDALQKYGIPKRLIFTDKESGAKADRPGLNECLSVLKPGDTLVVWRLDRLGRSIRHLIDLINTFQKKGIHFKSLMDGVIDTTTASGTFIFHVFSALAEFERRLISDRTQAGLEASRARGLIGGRRKIDKENSKVLLAKHLYQDKERSIGEICQQLAISRTTLYRYLKLK